MEHYQLRPAQPSEFAQLATIEDAAGRLYAQAGLPDDLDGLPQSEFAAAHRDGLLWVLAAANDEPIAFALGWRRDGAVHLRELDVHPEHQGQRLGRRLIEAVRQHAHREGRAMVTLTTFAEVAWNAPLYRRYGFTEVPPDQQPPWLAKIRADEVRDGLDRWPRVAMAIDARGPA